MQTSTVMMSLVEAHGMYARTIVRAGERTRMGSEIVMFKVM